MIYLFKTISNFKGVNLLYSYILATLLFSQEKNTAKVFEWNPENRFGLTSFSTY